jgi:16S rRNA (cytosine1402-N4)-methyltransferase
MHDPEPEAVHVPVLGDPVLALLAPAAGEVALDATLGQGGHAATLLPRLAPRGRLIGLDLDPASLEAARSRLTPLARQHEVTLSLHQANFRQAPAILEELGLPGVDLLLADLGFASSQMAEPSRGLSFNVDGPLDMRLDPAAATTAADLVNNLPQRELADVIYQYGEERLSRKIARKIVEKRREAPIQTTGDLARLVRRAYGPGGRKSRIDPATRTFQALRIAVNGELEALDALLEALPGLLNPGGRAAIISFHSLEDRRVKHAFQSLAHSGFGERLTRKPMIADEAEVASNPRSRSAKLRAFKRTADQASTDGS